MNIESYLDNSATTRVSASVAEMMMQVMEKDYGNPSSMHKKGMDAEQYIKVSREEISREMKVKPKEILFTSGGTESNNMALIGGAFANRRRGNHIISTRIEHPSVYNPLLFLEEQGFDITFLSVDKNGLIDLAELEQELRDDTILVSIMYINNEIGSVQDLARIGQVIKERNRQILFHVDAIQAYGKYRIYPERLHVDLLSVSGHKFHGPKGVGFLYIRDKVKIKPLIFGGGQQGDLRSGTENVPGIAGIGKASAEAYTDFSEKMEQLYTLKEYFVREVTKIGGAAVNGLKELDIRESAPHIISVSFQGVRSEVLLHALEEKQVFVSSGSACASNHPQISGTLQAIGVKKELLDSTLRFSLCVNTTREELDHALHALNELVPVLKRYTRH